MFVDKDEWDLLKVIRTIPANEAFMPLSGKQVSASQKVVTTLAGLVRLSWPHLLVGPLGDSLRWIPVAADNHRKRNWLASSSDAIFLAAMAFEKLSS